MKVIILGILIGGDSNGAPFTSQTLDHTPCVDFLTFVLDKFIRVETKENLTNAAISPNRKRGMDKSIILVITIFLTAFSCGKVEESACSITGTSVNDTGTSNFLGATSKGAQSFQVASTLKVTSIDLYLTTTNLTNLTVKIYQGGTNPENGTLVASGSTSTGLGDSSFKYISVPVSAHLFIPGNQYYLVHEGTGGTYSNKSGTPISFTLAGNYWEYNGTTWSSRSSEDLYFTLHYSSSCSQ